MKPTASKGAKVMAIAIVSLFVASSASAVTDSQVDTTLVQPENGTTVEAGGTLGGEIPYEVELSVDSGTNNTTTDLKLTFTDEDGNTYSTWVNDTSVDSGETVTVDGEYLPSDYSLPDNETLVTLDATATYTDDSDGSTATASDSNMFYIVASTMFGTIMGLVVVVVVIGAIMNEM